METLLTEILAELRSIKATLAASGSPAVSAPGVDLSGFEEVDVLYVKLVAVEGAGKVTLWHRDDKGSWVNGVDANAVVMRLTEVAVERIDAEGPHAAYQDETGKYGYFLIVKGVSHAGRPTVVNVGGTNSTASKLLSGCLLGLTAADVDDLLKFKFAPGDSAPLADLVRRGGQSTQTFPEGFKVSSLDKEAGLDLCLRAAEHFATIAAHATQEVTHWVTPKPEIAAPQVADAPQVTENPAPVEQPPTPAEGFSLNADFLEAVAPLGYTANEVDHLLSVAAGDLGLHDTDGLGDQSQLKYSHLRSAMLVTCKRWAADKLFPGELDAIASAKKVLGDWIKTNKANRAPKDTVLAWMAHVAAAQEARGSSVSEEYEDF